MKFRSKPTGVLDSQVFADQQVFELGDQFVSIFHNFKTDECTQPALCPICQGLITKEEVLAPGGLALWAKGRQKLGPLPEITE